MLQLLDFPPQLLDLNPIEQLLDKVKKVWSKFRNITIQSEKWRSVCLLAWVNLPHQCFQQTIVSTPWWINTCCHQSQRRFKMILVLHSNMLSHFGHSVYNFFQRLFLIVCLVSFVKKRMWWGYRKSEWLSFEWKTFILWLTHWHYLLTVRGPAPGDSEQK